MAWGGLGGNRRERSEPRIGAPLTESQFEDVYAANYEVVRGLAARRGRARDVEDLVAAVFLIAWRRSGQLPRDPAMQTVWFIRTTVFELRNHDRSRRRQTALGAKLLVPDRNGGGEVEPSAEDVAVGRRIEPVVEAALAGLNAADREILTLTAWEGLTTDELAAVLGCSPSAARTRLSRARSRLRRRLTEGGAP